jgi:hypothetical protein
MEKKRREKREHKVIFIYKKKTKTKAKTKAIIDYFIKR